MRFCRIVTLVLIVLSWIVLVALFWTRTIPDWCADDLQTPAVILVAMGAAIVFMDACFFWTLEFFGTSSKYHRFFGDRFRVDNDISVEEVVQRRNLISTSFYDVPSMTNLHLPWFIKSISELCEFFISRIIMVYGISLIIAWSFDCFSGNPIYRNVAASQCICMIGVALTTFRLMRHALSAMYFGLLAYPILVLVSISFLTTIPAAIIIAIASLAMCDFFAKPITTRRIARMPFKTKDQRHEKLSWIWWNETMFPVAEFVMGIDFVTALFLASGINVGE